MLTTDVIDITLIAIRKFCNAQFSRAVSSATRWRSTRNCLRAWKTPYSTSVREVPATPGTLVAPCLACRHVYRQTVHVPTTSRESPYKKKDESQALHLLLCALHVMWMAEGKLNRDSLYSLYGTVVLFIIHLPQVLMVTEKLH